MKKLKRVRHLRNNLAHNTDAFDEENCTQEDIQFVKDFHQRIINGTDPLQINLNKEEDEQISFDDRSYDRTESKNEKYVILTVCSFIIIVIVVIILILI